MSKSDPDVEVVPSTAASISNPEIFYEILFNKTANLHQAFNPSTSTPIYHIVEDEAPFQKPDIRLYAEQDKTYPLIGVVKIIEG
jgi:hypothetical protein